MFVTVPTGLRESVVGGDGGPEWLESIPARVERATERWGLVLGAPFETGVSAWTAPATTTTGEDVVLKLSYPHREARDEAAALAAWRGAGAVELLGADADDWALLLPRLRPGSSLQDAQLPPVDHLIVGAELMRRMATVGVTAGAPFEDLADVAADFATIAAERFDRLRASAPVPLDPGLCRHAVDLLRTLPAGAPVRGLVHGDLNPGNILRHDEAAPAAMDGRAGWLAIDPKPVHGDLAWDPWPLLTQVGDWITTVPAPAELAERTRVVAGVTGLDAARIAAWCVARAVESGLWAADRGWWTGPRSAEGHLARARSWATATSRLGG